MVRRIIGIVLLVAVIAIVANDVWRYVTAQQALRDTTYDLATWAATNAAGMSREAAGVQLAQMGQARGVTVYQYGQTDQGIQIWTETPVSGTIVAGTIANMIDGASFGDARTKPFLIRDYRQAGYQ